MAVCVVYALEIVEVKNHHRYGIAFYLGAKDFPFECGKEVPAVCQPCQFIGICE